MYVWILLRFCYRVLGTQRVISFLRQIVEHGGFYRTLDQTWITLQRIQFVGACNPPTDPGRKPLSHRCVSGEHPHTNSVHGDVKENIAIAKVLFPLLTLGVHAQEGYGTVCHNGVTVVP